MDESPDRFRLVLKTAVVWGLIWFALWQTVIGTIAIFDPDSIDPGEGWVAVAGWGIAATAIGQVPFLGHGDQGIIENLLLMLAFSLAGGLVTLVWLAFVRRWRSLGLASA